MALSIATRRTLLTPVAPAFTPLSLFGENDGGGFWDARTIEGDVGDPVATWTDLFGETALEQSVDGRKPTLRGSGNKRWLEFDIDDLDDTDVLGDCLLAEFAVSTAALTIVVAAHNEDDSEETGSEGNRRTICLKVPQSGGSERDINIHHNSNPYTEPDPDLNGAAGMRHPENAAILFQVEGNNDLSVPGIVSYVRNGTAIQDAWVDGEALPRVTTTTTTFTTTHLGVGYGLGTSTAFNTTGAGHWIGKIYGVFIIDRVLSAMERRAVERYMRDMIPRS